MDFTEVKIGFADDHNLEHSTDHNLKYSTDHNLEHSTDHNLEHSTDHNLEHSTDHNLEHSTDHNLEHSTDHNLEHSTDHNLEHSTDHNLEHSTDHNLEHSTDHNLEHIKTNSNNSNKHRDDDHGINKEVLFKAETPEEHQKTTPPTRQLVLNEKVINISNKRNNYLAPGKTTTLEEEEIKIAHQEEAKIADCNNNRIGKPSQETVDQETNSIAADDLEKRPTDSEKKGPPKTTVEKYKNNEPRNSVRTTSFAYIEKITPNNYLAPGKTTTLEEEEIKIAHQEEAKIADCNNNRIGKPSQETVDQETNSIAADDLEKRPTDSEKKGPPKTTVEKYKNNEPRNSVRTTSFAYIEKITPSFEGKELLNNEESNGTSVKQFLNEINILEITFTRELRSVEKGEAGSLMLNPYHQLDKGQQYFHKLLENTRKVLIQNKIDGKIQNKKNSVLGKEDLSKGKFENTDHNLEHSTDHNLEHSTDHNLEHSTDHNLEHSTDHNLEHSTDHNLEHSTDHNLEHN
ncbi:hypothetical protein Glove_16g62 [Diversispora epigaea]|uniref:Uncharacterized protein n=1 Tax=Diversispora epigaea TaxID=1348612 RepID=A0A397JN02_9GLOM|nr:hypothetical protein Glove_16g62 [Diversispora epigaea]